MSNKEFIEQVEKECNELYERKMKENGYVDMNEIWDKAKEMLGFKMEDDWVTWMKGV